MLKTGTQADTLREIVRGETNLRVIAVSSGKGGVGKTNVVANLAYDLCKRGKRVLIFDGDVGLANIHILLGLSPRFNLEHVLADQQSLRDILVEGPGGIKILPAGEGVEELTHLGAGARARLLSEFDHISNDYDFLIFDTGAGISKNVTFFCTAAQEVMLIATTEPTSLTDVYALIKILYQNHDQKYFRLIINSVKSESEALQIFRNLANVADKYLPHVVLEYFGHILADANVTKAVRRQRPFLELFPHSRVSQCLRQLCTRILDEGPPVSGDSVRPFVWRDAFQV